MSLNLHENENDKNEIKSVILEATPPPPVKNDVREIKPDMKFVLDQEPSISYSRSIKEGSNQVNYEFVNIEKE